MSGGRGNAVVPALDGALPPLPRTTFPTSRRIGALATTLTLAALSAGLLAAVAPAGAQAPRTLPDSGARVRIVVVDRDRVVGTLEAREPDRWLVRDADGDTVAVAPLQLERLDVSAGLRSPGRAFLRGAKLGAEVGVTVAVVATEISTVGTAATGASSHPG